MDKVAYSFHFQDGRTEQIDLHFSPAMICLDRDDAPWTALDVHRCSHCPLPPQGPCPFAAVLAPVIGRFAGYYSYEPVRIQVVTPQRTVMADRALQHGLASLIGLVGASSGCPHLDFFRPLARFHLPFATEEETLLRAFSFHLLGQYLDGDADGGDCIPTGFDRLQRHYHAATLVNQGMADRVRATQLRDAAVNALVVLDTFAQAVPYVIEDRLDEFRHVFAPTASRD